MHNHTPARVAFLEQVGFARAILARELDLEQLRAVRAATAIELEWQHMGRYFLEPTETHDYEGHELLHLRLNQQLSRHFSWSVRLTNLTDEQYADRADFAFGDYRYFIGEPRSLFVDIGWQL